MIDSTAFPKNLIQPDQLSWSIRLKWACFRLLERHAGEGTSRTFDAPSPYPVQDALWVFVATIGELNAIGPFLRELVNRLPHLRLVLITDRSLYQSSYLAQYPQAEVVAIGANSADAIWLATIRPPKLMVIAEIPCLPSDAPCRLPFSYLYAAKRVGSRLALVNGWLYGYAPSCRIDDIERHMFRRDYLRMLDVLCVQNEKIAKNLIANGADPDRVKVTGNIKFDALDIMARSSDQTPSALLLASLKQSGRPLIVVGCLKADDERDLVLKAFVLLLAEIPDAVLVLAPRHPEKVEVMNGLDTALKAYQMEYRLRSNSADKPFRNDEVVLVLDTLGELRDFYAVANIAHVGRNHNVLEPLAYNKPVSIQSGWEVTYPSYPIFELLSKKGLLIQHTASQELAKSWLQLMRDPTLLLHLQNKISNELTGMRGAAQKTFHALEQSGCMTCTDSRSI